MADDKMEALLDRADAILARADAILARGGHFRITWICRGCGNLCMSNKCDIVFAQGYTHEECGTTTPLCDCQVMDESNPVEIPEYEDLDPKCLEECGGVN